MLSAADSAARITHEELSRQQDAGNKAKRGTNLLLVTLACLWQVRASLLGSVLLSSQNKTATCIWFVVGSIEDVKLWTSEAPPPLNHMQWRL